MTKEEALTKALNQLKRADQIIQSLCPQGYIHPALCSIHGAIVNVQEALAQPEQEPVAWRAPNWGHSPDEFVYRDFDDPVLGVDGKPSPNNEPLFTHPQPKQPLTDEEIVAINDKHYNIAYRNFDADIAIAREIEAAHGIKGEA